LAVRRPRSLIHFDKILFRFNGRAHPARPFLFS
jgi:hypothetical protein